MSLPLKNWKRLRNFIAAQPPVKFSMSHWFAPTRLVAIERGDEHGTPEELFALRKRRGFYHECQTAACLAGSVLILTEYACEDLKYSGSSVEQKAGEWLGIPNHRQCYFVFLGQWQHHGTLQELTQRDALDYLDQVIATDSIWWQRATRRSAWIELPNGEENL